MHGPYLVWDLSDSIPSAVCVRQKPRSAPGDAVGTAAAARHRKPLLRLCQHRTAVTPAPGGRRSNPARTRVFSITTCWGSSGGEGTHRHVVPRENIMTTNASTAVQNITVKISPNDKGNPAGKLADAELHFAGGELEGLKLIGFALWERSGGRRNVTFPARQYAVNGERRSFALLRPIVDVSAQERVRDLILEAYAQYEAGE